MDHDDLPDSLGQRQARILAALVREGPATQAQLIEQTGPAHSILSCLNSLIRPGLVVVGVNGDAGIYQITDFGVRALKRHLAGQAAINPWQVKRAPQAPIPTET
jgi:hypothetical protein